MLIEQVKNPKITGAKENIVRLTMTLDQFHDLKDCVLLASQSAEKDSRMFLITTMIREDFINLSKQLCEFSAHGVDKKDKEAVNSRKNLSTDSLPMATWKVQY